MVIMTPPTHSFSLAAAFFQPLLDLCVPAHLSRNCHGIEDPEWLIMGVAGNIKDSSPAICAALRFPRLWSRCHRTRLS